MSEQSDQSMPLDEALARLRQAQESYSTSTFAWCPGCGYHHCGERCQPTEVSVSAACACEALGLRPCGQCGV